MEEDKEISEKILTLEELNKDLDDYNLLLDELTGNDKQFSQVNEKICPEERAELNWNLCYSNYTLYYSKS